MAINISDNSPRVSYTVAQGVTQSSFTVNFAFFDEADLNVYVDGVLKTIETDYTVTGGDGSTGSVSISVTGASGGSSVVITRDVEIERTTDFPSSGPFQIEALNTELDRITAIMADVQDQASRTMQLTDYDVSNNLTLPEVDGRKGRVLAFDEQTGAASVGPTISDTQSIADVSADIARLADIEDGTIATDAIQTAATNATAISTVSGSIANVNTVSTNIADVNSVATNMAEVLTADTNAATATTKAAEASASATAAAASETAAATSETNAATSETNAATSATSAASSASASASSASASASSATAAQTAETNAETAETNAATSATNAATSATNAATSATNASTSATNAATSATAASTAQTAAEAARDSALSAFDSFDDRYLGTKTSDPSVDNDGNALVAGALYFNTTASAMKVYTGSTWVAAYVSGTDYLALSGGEMTGDIKYGDNVKAKFGASDDLQIYHDGTRSYIDETGTGDLWLRAENLFLRDNANKNYLKGTTDAQVELFHNGLTKLATTSTGIDVTGTVTADGLTVDSGAGGSQLTLARSTTYPGLSWSTLISDFGGGGGDLIFDGSGANTGYGFRTRDSSNVLARALVIAPNRDISFYEDTGTTAKFFWDASAESLGIGTSSPEDKLSLDQPYVASGEMAISFNQSNFANRATKIIHKIDASGNGGSLLFATNPNGGDATERMAIDSSGRVGIGTTSPSSILHLSSAQATVRTIAESTNAAGYVGYRATNGSGYWEMQVDGSNQGLRWLDDGTERLRIDSSGRVGIGTSSPSANLEVYNSGSVYQKMQRGSTNHMLIGAESGVNSIYSRGSTDSTSLPFRILTGSTERLRVDANGNLLVGKTSADAGATVGVEATSSGKTYFTRDTSSTTASVLDVNKKTGDGTIIAIRKDGTTVGSIGTEVADTTLQADLYVHARSTAGSSTLNESRLWLLGGDSGIVLDGYTNSILPTDENSYEDARSNIGSSSYRFKDAHFSGTVNAANFNTTSDATLKTNVETLTGSLDAVKALRGVSYDWIDTGNSEVGVIAQEVEAVVPDVVSTNDQGIKSVKYGNLVGVLIEAIKEQQAQIDELKAKLGD